MSSPPAPRIICFGEILWDFLPAGLFPGGAPFNVAYHLHQHRAKVQVVSAVGHDVLGDELMRRIASWGLSTTGIKRLPNRPTGFVRATISPSGNAHYDIINRVAWDEITASPETLQAVGRTDALIFGSLAQRSASNRRLLQLLLASLPAKALKIFDVNLRAPHDDLERVRRLAHNVDLLKLNDLEAARLSGTKLRSGNDETIARRLSADFNCGCVVITAAARGAGLLHNDKWTWEKGRRVQVVDTVGAGDAFLASFVTHFLAGARDRELLQRACRLGEWVATQQGATPTYPKKNSEVIRSSLTNR